MASQAPASAPETQMDDVPQTRLEISANERFFRYFQHEITALQEQMDRLGDTAMIGGERSDAVDHCLAGIARLSSEVKDASASIPSYDQRIYADAIKALQDKLADVKASFAPRSKFAFKTARKNPSAISLADAAEIAAQGRRHIPGYQSHEHSVQSSAAQSPIYSPSLAPERPLSQNQKSSTTETTEGFKDALKRDPNNPENTARLHSVSLDSRTGAHIVLPASTSHAALPLSMTSLRHCVVDMSIPTTNSRPFAGLSIKGVTESLLVCGQVNGPAHITGVKQSVIVVTCHQFRMHDCVDVDVYLSCSSKPIIEDCSNIRFGKIPDAFVGLYSHFTSLFFPEMVEELIYISIKAQDPSCRNRTNLWDQVEDFKWIKAEQSPNWKLMDESDAIPENVWTDTVPGGPGVSVDAILKATSVIKA
ncbi:hypothetical protein FQN55_006354 [Onygenales sp. PD_40]|nr:hypothetical protein FQN55_006354 [Onygenales sp. PD_40]